MATKKRATPPKVTVEAETEATVEEAEVEEAEVEEAEVEEAEAPEAEAPVVSAEENPDLIDPVSRAQARLARELVERKQAEIAVLEGQIEEWLTPKP